MAWRLGEFNSDGTRKVIELVDGNVDKPRFGETTGWEKTLYQIGRNTPYLLAAQDDGTWQGATRTAVNIPFGTIDIDVSPDDGVANAITVFNEIIADISQDAVQAATMVIWAADTDDLSITLDRAYRRDRINVASFLIDATVFDLTGQPTAENHYFNMSLSSATALLDSWNIVVKLEGPSADWIADDEKAFNPVKDGKLTVLPDTGLVPGRIYLASRSQYVRRVRYVRVGDATSTLYLFQVYFYLGRGGSNMSLLFSPCYIDAAETPHSMVTTDGFAQWVQTPALTGLRFISRAVWLTADEEFFSDQTVVRELIHTPGPGNELAVSSGAVADAIEVVNVSLNTARNRADQAQADLNSLTADRGDTVKAGRPVLLGATMYVNTSDKDVILVEVPTEDYLVKTLGFTKAAGGGGDTEFLISDTDLTGIEVTAGKTMGIWHKAGQADMTFVADKEGKWVSNFAAVEKAQAELTRLQTDKDAQQNARLEALEKNPPIKAIGSVTNPTPWWPAGVTPSNTQGSLLVRLGQVDTVDKTLFNNIGIDSNSWQFSQSFSAAADRGKAVEYHAALPVADTARNLRMTANALQASIGATADITLSHNGTTWVATGSPAAALSGSRVEINKGFAVLIVPFSFAALDTTVLYTWATPGSIQLPSLYEAGKGAIVSNISGLTLTDPASGVTRDILDATLPALASRVGIVEGKLNVLAPVFASGGGTRADSAPFINIPDRAGARFDKLSFTVRDSRKNVAGGWNFPIRVASVDVPAAWLSTTPPAAAATAGWAFESHVFGSPSVTRTSIKRVFTWQDPTAAVYTFWLEFARNGDSWDIWFQSIHASGVNLYGGVYDITASYVADATAVDPKLAPIVKSIDDEVARAKAAEAATTTALTAEVTRAKAAEKANSDAIAALPTSSSAVQYYGAPVVDFSELRGIAAPKVSEKRFVIDANKSFMFRKVYIGSWAGHAAYDGTGAWFEDPWQYFPNNGWIGLLSWNNYLRKLRGDIFKSLSFDYTDPDDVTVQGNFTSFDFVTGYVPSGFYGGNANFNPTVMTSGRTVKPVVCFRPDNELLIYVTNNAGTKGGTIRKVTINGMAADLIIPDFSTFALRP
jgi:hypothetical protein